MTKTENRAAAKAHYQEQEQKRREFARAEVVKADLAELERLRQNLMFGKKPGEPAHELIDAIDDYVAKLTGEDDAPHAQSPLRMSWCRVFDDTILLPGRKALRTLLKAGEYSSSLPKKEHAAWMASRYGSADPGAERRRPDDVCTD
ncbi:hypothetical protein AB8Z38_34125 [Bradyrhizobium sp. LLZ17]|uniref:Uncharacterized protein n=1 Tax=Bradyrhizobium sp. LLZ17 TaxID=3239388 RepID=A0AB39XMI6_9BRAD